MSKFLKFIVHFVVICTILCVVALAVPPFFGVTTEIRDKTGVKSNLAMGSVTYAIPVKTEDAAIGTPILVNDGDNVYRYTLASADVANGSWNRNGSDHTPGTAHQCSNRFLLTKDCGHRSFHWISDGCNQEY